MYFTSNDRSENMFAHKPALDTLGLKKHKSIDYIPSLKSNGVFSSKPKPLSSIKLSKYEIRIKFVVDPLALEQNNYLTKIVNSYIVYELYDWAKVPVKNFTL